MTRFLLFFLVCVSAVSFGQNSGLYGKRRFIELSGITNLTVRTGMMTGYEDYYSVRKSHLAKANDLFNGGLYVALGTAPKRHFGFTLEAGWWFYNIAGPEQRGFRKMGPGNEYIWYDLRIKHEHVDARTFSAMPILEFSAKRSSLPIGLSHQAGIGFSKSRLVEKDYLSEPAQTSYWYIDPSGNSTSGDPQALLDSLNASGDYINYKRTALGLTLMYALKIRTPITKRLMLTYGVRYTFNRVLNSGTMSGNSKWTSYDLESTRRRNWISLNLGIAYAF